MASLNWDSWPEQPFRLITTTSHATTSPSLPSSHAAVRIARLMALTHNTIFRAFNAVYTQSVSVHPDSHQDVLDLVQFTTFALEFLENHHTVEETVFFPMLEAQTKAPGLMSGNVDQHREFDRPLRSLKNYLEEVKSETTRFSASELRHCIDVLATPLERHLFDEIPTLLATGQQLSEDMMETCYKAMHDEAEGTTDPFRMGPLVLGCQDRGLLLDGERMQFPELPFALVPYIVDWVMYRRYAGAWRFCPSTFHGQPRDTPFFRRKRDGPLEAGRADRMTRGSQNKSNLLYLVIAVSIVFYIVFYKGAELWRLSSRWNAFKPSTSLRSNSTSI